MLCGSGKWYRLRVHGLTLALSLILIACGPNQRPDTLTLGGPFEFNTQDPSRDGFVYTRLQIAESLLEVDDTGRLLPGLAHDWSVSEDRLTWHFFLRPEVRFHDGLLMDAESVVNALYQARRKPGVINDPPIREIRAESALTVAIELERPYNPLGAVMAHFSSVILSPASYRDDAYVRNMWGTGPYRVTDFDPPHSIGAARFEQYWGEAANIENVTYLTGHRAESRALQVMAGQTDIIYTLDPASLDLLQRREDVRVYSDFIPRTIQLKLNASHPLLGEREVRQAMSLALDRTGISERIIRVPGMEANQLVPPMLGDWHDPDLPVLKQDLEQARQLMLSIGWLPGADGILRRDGERFRLQLITYADRPELTVVATAIQAQLRAIGMDIGVSVVNSSVIPSSHLDGSLEMALVARNYGNVADPLGVMIADYGDGGSGEWGATGWYNAELPYLLEALQEEQDLIRYRDMARRISRILVAEMPVVPVLYYTQQTAVSARVQNFSFDPYERNYRVADMYFDGRQ